MNNKEIFEIIKNKILDIKSKKSKPVRVAINGIEGTGKTTFSEKLTTFLNKNNILSIHVTIDGYHFDKKVRYRQGRDSARGYYEDSYDEKSFVEKVLISSQSDKPYYIKAIHDLETDEYLDTIPEYINLNTVLITDGAYLFKPNYRNHWDLKIYLKTDFNTAMERGIKRDLVLFGNYENAKEKYLKRYHKASEIYINENNPLKIADIIIDNSNFDNLKILKNI